MVEQLTLNQRVGGSSPPRLTTIDFFGLSWRRELLIEILIELITIKNGHNSNKTNDELISNRNYSSGLPISGRGQTLGHSALWH